MLTASTISLMTRMSVDEMCAFGLLTLSVNAAVSVSNVSLLMTSSVTTMLAG